MKPPLHARTYEGGCLCGEIRYSARAPLRPVVACHCAQCRRTSGNYVTATACARAGLTIKGAPVWYQSSQTAQRGFCGSCGSQLFWDGQGAHVSIMAGTLDDASGLELAGHIFCADKGAYYEITDGLPATPHDDPALTHLPNI